MKLTERVRVKNRLGLHTRPATMIVRLLQGNPCDVTFSYRKETINAKSLLSILMLAVTKNSMITIKAEGRGDDARKIMKRLVSAFEDGFGE